MSSRTSAHMSDSHSSTVAVDNSLFRLLRRTIKTSSRQTITQPVSNWSLGITPFVSYGSKSLRHKQWEWNLWLITTGRYEAGTSLAHARGHITSTSSKLVRPLHSDSMFYEKWAVVKRTHRHVQGRWREPKTTWGRIVVQPVPAGFASGHVDCSLRPTGALKVHNLEVHVTGFERISLNSMKTMLLSLCPIFDILSMRYLRGHNLQQWGHMLNLLIQHEMGCLGPRQKQHCYSAGLQHRGSLGGVHPCRMIDISFWTQLKAQMLIYVLWNFETPVTCNRHRWRYQDRLAQYIATVCVVPIGIGSALKSEDSQCPYMKQSRKRPGKPPLPIQVATTLISSDLWLVP